LGKKNKATDFSFPEKSLILIESILAIDSLFSSTASLLYPA